MNVQIPEVFQFLFSPYRYKVIHGGRGSGKSWNVARVLLILAASKKLLIVCGREFQNSIDDSVHRLLSNQIRELGLDYTVEKYRIYNDLGSEFVFKGLSKQDAAGLKSLEGADILWVEEAHNVSDASWQNVIPTIRKEGSEIWITFNPYLEDDPTYQRFVVNPPDTAFVQQVNYTDNPWFPEVLNKERLHNMKIDMLVYRNVWLGECREIGEGAFYADQIIAAKEAGRIGRVPHDPSLPVITYWDLGGASEKSDPTSIWFVQALPTGAFSLINYWEGHGKSLSDIVREVIKPLTNDMGYDFDKHVIPHDGAHGNRQTGQTDEDTLRQLGLPVETQPRTKSVRKDIDEVRKVLPRCWFDSENCKLGLKALSAYRQEKNRDGVWKYKHDWSSHGADAFRYFAVGYNPPTQNDYLDTSDTIVPI